MDTDKFEIGNPTSEIAPVKYASLVTPVNFTGLKMPEIDTAPPSQLHSRNKKKCLKCEVN